MTESKTVTDHYISNIKSKEFFSVQLTKLLYIFFQKDKEISNDHREKP